MRELQKKWQTGLCLSLLLLKRILADYDTTWFCICCLFCHCFSCVAPGHGVLASETSMLSSQSNPPIVHVIWVASPNGSWSWPVFVWESWSCSSPVLSPRWSSPKSQVPAQADSNKIKKVNHKVLVTIQGTAEGNSNTWDIYIATGFKIGLKCQGFLIKKTEVTANKNS